MSRFRHFISLGGVFFLSFFLIVACESIKMTETQETSDTTILPDGAEGVASGGELLPDDPDETDPEGEPAPDPEDDPDADENEGEPDPLADSDGDGDPDDTDCAKDDPDIHKDAPEICDGVDNNCDGNIDEGVTVAKYPDADSDGYGDKNAAPVQLCDSETEGFVTDNTDCVDDNAKANPGMTKDCAKFGTVTAEYEGVDNDCDQLNNNGGIDEDGDCTIWTPGTILTQNPDLFVRGTLYVDTDEDTPDDVTDVPTGPTPFIEKIKVTIANLNETGAGINNSNFSKIKFGINFKNGQKFNKCTMDALKIEHPAGFDVKGGSGYFTVDLTQNNNCFADPNIDHASTLQLDNIDEIYLQATGSGTGWGIRTIKMEAEYSDDPNHRLLFYDNQGVWAYVGNKEYFFNHYPRTVDSAGQAINCVTKGAYYGFKNFTGGRHGIKEINATGSYKIPSFPKATLSFRPGDIWYRVYFKTKNTNGAGGSKKLMVRFDCDNAQYLELFNIAHKGNSKSLRFYSPNASNNNLSDFYVSSASKYKFGENGIQIDAFGAWNSEDGENRDRRTVKHRSFKLGNDFTLNKTSKKWNLSEGTANFPARL